MSDSERSIGGMLSEFERARRRYASGASSYSPLEAEALRIIEGLERAALKAVYDENEQGGHARQVVGSVACVLGVDIDEGPGHRWEPDHMARVVDVADKIREQRDDLMEEVERLSDAQQELRAWVGEVHRLRVEVATQAEDADGLRATIVSQARELARLKGESA